MRGLRPNHRRAIRPRTWVHLVITALLLLGLSGGHWWVLQSVAWSGMLVSYSAKSGFIKGVGETFDGEHPCPMCKAIRQARDSESSPADTLAASQKAADLLGLPVQPEALPIHESFAKPAPTSSRAKLIHSRPLLPPPRAA